MPNRLDIELTSLREDGSYTWRAAGARQPKGVIDAKILTAGAKVGDVLRVEAEFEIDGITILCVLPPKEKATPSGRIELLSSSKPVPGVTTVLLSEGGRGRGGDRRDLLDSPRRADRSASRDRRPPREAERRDTRSPEPRSGAPSAAGDQRPERRPPTVGGRESGSARASQNRGGASGPVRRPGTAGSSRRSAPAGGDQDRSDARSRSASRPRSDARSRSDAKSRSETGPRSDSRPEAAPRTSPADSPSRRTVPRFEPKTVHRDALIASLAPEQRPIAERLAAGGIPAVRRAVAEERERARSEGRPEASGEAILALAEQLAPAVKQATWLDRAEAALAQLDRISLRDLRTTVVAAAPRDEAGRELDRKLREELDRRVTKLRTNWEEQITHALEEGRVLQALRLSAQPPEPTARFPAGLVERLATSASAAMTSSTPPERWLAILDAAVASPIRRQIHPEGIPDDPSGESSRKAKVAAGSLPALAPLLGLSMPPPPKPVRPTRPVRPPRPPRPSGRSMQRQPRSASTLPEPSAEAALPAAPAEEALVTPPSEEALPAAPADDALPVAPDEEALPAAPAEDALAPAPNEDALPAAPAEQALPAGAAEEAAEEAPDRLANAEAPEALG